MYILFSTSSFVPVKPRSAPLQPCFNPLPLSAFGCYPEVHVFSSRSIKFQPVLHDSSCTRKFPIGAANASDQGTASLVEFEDFVEKDWSFLEFDDTDSNREHTWKIDRIISAGDVKETSKILVSIGSEAFVDRVFRSSPCEQLLVVHESLLVLACIKERHDRVKCWQGELVDLPEKWASFDAVYLYFLPALALDLDQVLASVAKRCLPGARVVISHPHGRGGVEGLQQRYPDVVVSSLAEKETLLSAAANHSFEVVEFADEPGFYLAVLRFNQD